MTTLKTLSIRLAVMSFAAFAPVAAFAVDEHYLTDGVAASGYDVVAYHTLNAPTKGDAAYSATYQGATWIFASAENRDLFQADPVKYAPAYGGWCSAGASKGKKVATMPEFFAIVDGQLYLNSTQKAHEGLFLKDTATVIDKGEANWKRIFATEANAL
ncbi:MAG: YHS domain-containing (seleno)protein [Gemmobacter sp.]